MLTDETRYKLLRMLEANPQASQRDLAQSLGISVGKVNYCLNALIERGWLKAKNFKNNKNKRAYMYYLTPVDSKKRPASRCASSVKDSRSMKRSAPRSRASAAKLRRSKPKRFPSNDVSLATARSAKAISYDSVRRHVPSIFDAQRAYSRMTKSG